MPRGGRQKRKKWLRPTVPQYAHTAMPAAPHRAGPPNVAACMSACRWFWGIGNGCLRCCVAQLVSCIYLCRCMDCTYKCASGKTYIWYAQYWHRPYTSCDEHVWTMRLKWRPGKWRGDNVVPVRGGNGTESFQFICTTYDTFVCCFPLLHDSFKKRRLSFLFRLEISYFCLNNSRPSRRQRLNCENPWRALPGLSWHRRFKILRTTERSRACAIYLRQ